MTYTPANGALCDWCESAATSVVLDPYALDGHSLACNEHAAQHYGIVA